jgi:hypothetical protein
MTVIRRRKDSQATKTVKRGKKAARGVRKAVKAWAIYKTVRRFTPPRIALYLAGLVGTAVLAALARRKSSSTAEPVGAVPAPTFPPTDPEQVEHRYEQTQQTGV